MNPTEPPWSPHFSGFAPPTETPTTHAEPSGPEAPIDRLETLWRAKVPSAARILASSHAVVSLREQHPALAWDPSGRPLPPPPLVGTAAALDRTGTHILGVTADGMPALAALGARDRPPLIALHYMGTRDIHSVVRCGDVFAIATSTRPAWPVRRRSFTLLEFMELRDPDDVDECGYVEGIEDFEALSCAEETPASVVAGVDRFAAATNEAVTIFGLAGDVMETVQLPCRPRGLALTTGGSWTAVLRFEDAVELWWDGGAAPQRVRTELAEWAESRPPLPAGEDFAFLVPPGEVLGCSREAQTFRFRRVGDSQGAVTSAGELLLEHEHGLWACDRHGAARQVWAGSAPITCAPVLLDDRVFIATADELVALCAKR